MTDRNVLDLRQVAQERARAAKHHRGRRPPPGFTPGVALHPVDWPGLRRELAKYAFGFIIAGTLVAFILIGINTGQHINQASDTAKRGVQNIEAGVTALNAQDGKLAMTDFATAKQNLAEAQQQLAVAVSGMNQLVAHAPIIGHQYTAANTLLQAAANAADAGYDASAIIPANPTTNSGITIENNGIIRGSLGWFSALTNDPARLQHIVDLLLSSYRAAATLSARSVPASIRPTFQSWQAIGDGLFGSPDRLNQIVKIMVGIAGQSREQNYVLMFQNNDELRPTGGFMGSYVLVKFQQGTFAVTDAPGNGPYALKDQTPKTIRPPIPLDQITPSMAIEDANWYPDARVSAAAIMEVYRQARGFKPDGVIFVTPEIVERLLAITGPILEPGTQIVVTSDTFMDVAEKEAELNYNKALNAPKALIIGLLPELLKKISTLPTADGLRAIATLLDETDRGNIMVTSGTTSVATAAHQLNWDGAVDMGTSDALAIVDANVNSGKTDLSITTDAKVEIQPGSGDWTHVLTLTRHDIAKPDELFHSADDTEYIRVIVPPGSNLTSIDGATTPASDMFITPSTDTKPLILPGVSDEITFMDPVKKTTLSHSSSATTFGFWSTIKQGQSQTITITYTVPHGRMVKNGAWSMLWRRQPGTENRTWSVRMDASGGNFKPTTPLSGWTAGGDKWIWKGSGDYSTTISGAIKEK